MGDSKPPASAETKKPKRDAAGDVRETPPLTLWWKKFWMWRLGVRMMWALILALLALLALIYLVLPVGDQAQLAAFSQVIIEMLGHSLGAASMRMTMLVVLVVSMGASIALLLLPASAMGAYRYLFPPITAASYTTVLLDIENLVGNPAFGILLAEVLAQIKEKSPVRSGGTHNRIDLLFFMDAKHLQSERETEYVPKGPDRDAWHRNINLAYRLLISSGFRLINSPHNPTGARRLKGNSGVKEAADREIEFLAFERALLSKVKQTFVLVSGDGDFAPLIYRLIALGHDVQIWKWGSTTVYDDMKRGLPSLIVEHFPRSQAAVTGGITKDAQMSQPTPGASSQGQSASPERLVTVTAENVEQLKKVVFTPEAPSVDTFLWPYMDDVYYTIYNSVELCKSIGKLGGAADAKRTLLSTVINESELKHRLAEVGFSGHDYSKSWVRVLTVIDALSQPTGGFPRQGSIAASAAARRLHALTLAVARAVASAPRDLNDDVNHEAIRAQLGRVQLTNEVVGVLRKVVKAREVADTDIRFLALCAGKLGLLEYAEVIRSSRLIRSPRLTPLAEEIIAQQETVIQQDSPEATV